MGDQQDRRAESLPQVGEQVEDLGLDGDVEGCRGLVGNHEVGLACKGHRNHHPLSHAAGELMRIFIEPSLGIGEPYEPEHLERPCSGLLAAAGLVKQNCLGDLIAHREHRIEARHRLLEDHPDPPAPDLPQVLLGQRDEVDGARGRVERD